MRTGSPATDQELVDLEYRVLDGAPVGVRLAAGAPWTFGRSPACSVTLALPALSRVSLVVQYLGAGLLRVLSRQSNRGRVLVQSDDGIEQHVIGLGSGPVHLTAGTYALKLELPPVVLRMCAAVPLPSDDPRRGPLPRGVSPAAERTRLGWEPQPGAPVGPAWIAVTALATTLTRYPELTGPGDGADGQAVRRSEALRRAVALWCGHTSRYWVNQRIKEAAEAADLRLKDGGDRVGPVVAHYAPLFPDTVLRRMRDDLLRLGLRASGG